MISLKLIVAVLFCIILYWLQKQIYMKIWTKKLNIHISFRDKIVSEGESTYLEEVIENYKLLPLPILHVKFSAPSSFLFKSEENTVISDYFYRNDVYSILSYQRIIRKYPFVCSKRGFYTLRSLDIISRDLFLTELLASQESTMASINVLPRKLPFEKLPAIMVDALGEVVRRQNLYEDPFEFKGIRDYQPYDRMHAINWKSTARTGALQVNTYQSTSSKQVCIYLNLEPNSVTRAEYLQEESIRLASTIAGYLLSRQVPLSFYTNGLDKISKKPFQVEAGSGKQHIQQIDLSLSRIDLSIGHSSSTNLLKDALTKDPKKYQLIIISTYRKKDMMDLYQDILQKGFSTLYILPEFTDNPVSESIPNTVLWEVDYHEKIS